MKITIIELIQSMLAPGIMVSACGLFILSMNNKYSMIVNRIRLLNQEERNITPNEEKNTDVKERSDNIYEQIGELTKRLKLVRNAVFSYSIAVALFILSSLFIGLKYAISQLNFEMVVIALFLSGMICVLAGIFFAAKEVMKGYDIILIETKNLDKE